MRKIADDCGFALPEHKSPQAWVGFSEPSCMPDTGMEPRPCLAPLFPELASKKKNRLLEWQVEKYLCHIRKKLGNEGAEEIKYQNSDGKIMEDLILIELKGNRVGQGDDMVYERCDWCGEAIRFGNAVVSIQKNIEQVEDSPEYENGVITVIRSDSILNLCTSCGNHLDEDKLLDYLKLELPD